MTQNNYKIVVFDLDETLGYFQELSFFIDAIENVLNINISKEDFNKLLDNYPEFLRPNIFSILDLIKNKKKKNNKIKVMIYTNNQNPKKWALDIKDYFNSKLNYDLFENVIGAFKINGQRIELSRTSHNKTYSDFIRCTKLPKNTNICFIDDQHHSGMINNNVYYIKVKPYMYSISFEEMAKRYYINNKLNIEMKTFINNIALRMKSINLPIYEKSNDELNIDNIVSKSIIHHLSLFLNGKIKEKTQKNKIKQKKHKTLKIY